jgi:7-cyano-7-deazaguanine synthase
MGAERRAVVLLSGGLDSSVTAALARDEGYLLHALTIDYGQRHRVELEAARRVAGHLGVPDHRVVGVDLRALGGSALTGGIEVPKGRLDGSAAAGEVPVTYVPARNAILLSLAVAHAEVVGAFDLFLGANVVDYSGYPDCRPTFLEAFEGAANLATRAGTEGEGRFRVRAPLLRMTKAEIVALGVKLGLDLSLTWSCYDPAPGPAPCGGCDACVLRARGFAGAGIPDPAIRTSGG